VKLSDDEAITTALLHGAPRIAAEFGRWYIDPDRPAHEVELANRRPDGAIGFDTRALAAHAYCKFYNLEG
jgi:N-formylglutamate amidohydrolase